MAKATSYVAALRKALLEAKNAADKGVYWRSRALIDVALELLESSKSRNPHGMPDLRNVEPPVAAALQTILKNDELPFKLVRNYQRRLTRMAPALRQIHDKLAAEQSASGELEQQIKILHRVLSPLRAEKVFVAAVSVLALVLVIGGSIFLSGTRLDFQRTAPFEGGYYVFATDKDGAGSFFKMQGKEKTLLGDNAETIASSADGDVAAYYSGDQVEVITPSGSAEVAISGVSSIYLSESGQYMLLQQTRQLGEQTSHTLGLYEVATQAEPAVMALWSDTFESWASIDQGVYRDLDILKLGDDGTVLMSYHKTKVSFYKWLSGSIEETATANSQVQLIDNTGRKLVNLEVGGFKPAFGFVQGDTLVIGYAADAYMGDGVLMAADVQTGSLTDTLPVVGCIVGGGRLTDGSAVLATMVRGDTYEEVTVRKLSDLGFGDVLWETSVVREKVANVLSFEENRSLYPLRGLYLQVSENGQYFGVFNSNDLLKFSLYDADTNLIWKGNTKLKQQHALDSVKIMNDGSVWLRNHLVAR